MVAIAHAGPTETNIRFFHQQMRDLLLDHGQNGFVSEATTGQSKDCVLGGIDSVVAAALTVLGFVVLVKTGLSVLHLVERILSIVAVWYSMKDVAKL